MVRLIAGTQEALSLADGKGQERTKQLIYLEHGAADCRNPGGAEPGGREGSGEN